MYNFIIGREARERSVFLIFMFILMPILVIRSFDFPINVDEPIHYEHAKDVIDWYITKGENKACLDTPWTNLKYYGQSVDNLTALINRTIPGLDDYRVRHVTGALFAWLFILFTGLLAFEITGRYTTAIIAVIALTIIPPVMGQYCNNLKDIPFATGYVFSIWSMVRVIKSLPRVPWKQIISLALSIAFLISLRVGGLIIFPYFALFTGIWLLLKNKFSIFKGERKELLYRLVFQLFFVAVSGYFLGLLFWPYGLIKPLTHPFESLSVMEDYSILIRQIFEGKWYWSKFLPHDYLAKWLLISLPLVILAGILLYAILFFTRIRRISFTELIVLFTLLFPLVYVVLIRSNLYSGWRQMYFVSGHIAVITAIGVEEITRRFARKKLISAMIISLIIIGSIFPVIHYFRNPDTGYIYFNELAGGNRKAWSNYEYDYYWHGMKKASEWFDEQISPSASPVTVASNFNESLYLDHRQDIQVKYVHFDNRSTLAWDYGIFGINYIHPDQLKQNMWEATGTIKIVRDSYGVPLAVIIKRKSLNDFEGIQQARFGNYNQAEDLLSKAIAGDPNNFVLYEYKAECLYNAGDTISCQTFINSAKEIHPWSERINMIDAQLDYDAGKYEDALNKCLKIVDNNNKYYNIVPILISCYEKLGNLSMARYYQEILIEREKRLSKK